MLDPGPAYGRQMPTDYYHGSAVVLACLVAATSDDEHLVVLRQGRVFWTLQRVPGTATAMEVAGILSKADEHHDPDVTVLERGPGDAVVSAGKVLGRRRWMRAELDIDQVLPAIAEWLPTAAIEKDVQLRDELAAVRADDLSSIGSRVRALGLTFAVPVPSQRRKRAPDPRQRVQPAARRRASEDHHLGRDGAPHARALRGTQPGRP